MARRLRGRVQLTTDGHAAYLSAVAGAFGNAIDYAMLVKVYGVPADALANSASVPVRMLGRRPPLAPNPHEKLLQPPRPGHRPSIWDMSAHAIAQQCGGQ